MKARDVSLESGYHSLITTPQSILLASSIAGTMQTSRQAAKGELMKQALLVINREERNNRMVYTSIVAWQQGEVICISNFVP